MERLHRVTGTLASVRTLALLLTFVFLACQGCGCCDDTLPPGDEECCCTFEWIHEQTNFPNATVNVVLVGANPSLGAVASPAQLVGVNPLVPQVFQICVQTDHAPGASVTVEFREQNTNSLMGAALLTYDEQCLPTVELLTPRIEVYSTDCGMRPDCCCDYLWRVPGLVGVDGDGSSIEIHTVNVDASLMPVSITPNNFPSVSSGDLLAFEICVNLLHEVGASMEILIEEVSGADLGHYLLTYDERCVPEITPLLTAPQPPLLSPECGPPCCCNFGWVVESDAIQNVNIEIQVENADASLMPTVVPNMFDNISFGFIAGFEVCVSAAHTPGAMMELVIVDRDSGAELDRVFVTYTQTCLASLFEEPNNPGAGTFVADCNLIGDDD